MRRTGSGAPDVSFGGILSKSTGGADPYNGNVHPGRTVVLLRRAVGAALCLLAILAAHSAGSEQGRAKRISFSILEDYDKVEDLAEVAKDFALFRELGITAWRGSFGWDDYEPSRGHYAF